MPETARAEKFHAADVLEQVCGRLPRSAHREFLAGVRQVSLQLASLLDQRREAL